MTWTHKSKRGTKPWFLGQHKFEHWYRDNQTYFLTARYRGKFRAFASGRAKEIFWDRFDQYTTEFGFVSWVTSLMDNHYHTLGYLRTGANLGSMMQRLHGSVAKMVNDVLETQVKGTAPLKRGCLERSSLLNEQGGLKPFWRDTGHKDYYDGCIRDERQCRRAYRYTLTQAQRHGIVRDWRDYPHTKVNVEVERAIKRAAELDAFLGACGIGV